MVSSERLSLPVLLSRNLGHLTDEVEAGVGPAMPTLGMWSNLVRCVDAKDGLNEKALPEAARVSKRLATAAITAAKNTGWITAEGAAKNRELSLTDAGRAATEQWPAHLATLDNEWRKSGLRSPLEKLVAQLDLELPHFPAGYGAADPSAIGGPFVRRKGEGLVHGTDWRPVKREGDTVSSLPLTALLSQALMAFTIDYENGFPWPLNSTMTRLVHIDSEPRPLNELPPNHGVSGDGKSLLERHLIVEVSVDPADPKRKLVALTDRGKQVKQHHPARLETVESEWRDRFGSGLIDTVSDALTPLAAAAASQPDHVIWRWYVR